ncbi:histidine kinase internal region [Gemmatirosa kalamazoonensis]|uniref:Histidine kinase internal region n=1 Tax=Gemmatirosa kalamazoonensis TaxID=861299 RepID=W0RGS7_9BACT|nr:histidine kinase [Gemmatirosa kalamazoonensis]AHG89632.1 histidine kinase internal region [Gemmatirosa kalamazoonensis]
MPRRLSPALVLALIVPGIVALMSATQSWMLMSHERGPRPPYSTIAGYNLATWYLWAALAPLIVALGRRFPLDGARWRRSLPVHVVAGAAIAFAHAAATTVFVWLGIRTIENESLSAMFRGTTFSRFHFELLLYFAILGATLAIDYHRAFRDRAVQASALATELAQARLRALKMQLHPHFLFNTLHAITVLVDEDPAAARRMVARLGELLRHTLAANGSDEVPLGAELDFLRLYLEIEETRFQDRLRVSYDVAPDAQAALVPDLILQPLVENAVKHAVSARTAPVRVTVSARREGTRLELRVDDDGPGLGDGAPRDGIGLSTTRERLARLYGDAGRLTLGPGSGGVGASAVVELPYRPAA